MAEYIENLNLCNLRETAYVWVGAEFPPLMRLMGEATEPDDAVDAIPLLVGLDRAFDIPVGLRPFMEFFKYPRTQYETDAWFEEHAVNDNRFLDWLLSEKLIVRVEPGSGIMASFDGLHLQSNAMLLPDSGQMGSEESDPGLVMVSNNVEMNQEIELTPLTRSLLFGYPYDDIKESIVKAAKAHDVTPDEAQNAFLENVAHWMRDDCAFLLYME